MPVTVLETNTVLLMRTDLLQYHAYSIIMHEFVNVRRLNGIKRRQMKYSQYCSADVHIYIIINILFVPQYKTKQKS